MVLFDVLNGRSSEATNLTYLHYAGASMHYPQYRESLPTAFVRITPRPALLSQMKYLGSHAARTTLVEHEGIGVEQPAGTGVGKASDQFGADGNAGSTLEGREGARDHGAVVVRGPFKGPSVHAWYSGAVVFIAGKVGVHGVPDVVLPSRNAQHIKLGHVGEVSMMLLC